MSAALFVFRLTLGLAVSGAAFGAVGCAAVKPWQREKLASPVMEAAFAESALEIGYRAKVIESKTGGGLPGTASGGGCGCTQ